VIVILPTSEVAIQVQELQVAVIAVENLAVRVLSKIISTKLIVQENFAILGLAQKDAFLVSLIAVAENHKESYIHIKMNYFN
jgi:hypothetical protein